jgi:hypothetical protein
VEEFATLVVDDEEAGEDLEGGGGDVEEVDAGGAFEVELEEGLPVGAAAGANVALVALAHGLADCGLVDREAEHEQLAVDTRRAPEFVQRLRGPAASLRDC